MKECLIRMRHRLIKHKTALTNVFVALASIFIVIGGILQSDKSDLQNKLVYQVGMMDATHSAVSANNSEIILDRSLAEWCQSNPNSGCGTNNVLLKIASLQKTPFEGSDIAASDAASSTFAVYSTEAPLYDLEGIVAESAALLFLLLTIVINSL